MLSWSQLLVSSPMLLIFFIGLNYMIIKVLVTITFFYIICYFFQLKVNKLAKSIKAVARLNYNETNWKMEKILQDLNMICSKVARYNKFWSSVVRYFLLTMFPVNLCATNLISSLLESESKFKIYLIAIDILIIVYTWVFIFFISYCMATISYNIHKNYKHLFRIQLNTKTKVLTKFKIMNAFERIGSKKKIGFEVKNFFVMTYPALYRVRVLRYLLIT